MDDEELLEIEIDTLWTADRAGRLRYERGSRRRAPHMVLSVTDIGYALAFGLGVTPALEAELDACVREVARFYRARLGAAALARCLPLIEEALGPSVTANGPSYYLPVGAGHGTALNVVTSRDASQNASTPVPSGWRKGEWGALLKGRAPWAMALDNGQVVSLCHSARWGKEGAEAGVWTHPEHRRRGLAAAVTRAWADLVTDTGRVAFYSTSHDNIASQMVAVHLGARCFGWIWSVRPAPAARLAKLT